MSIALPLSLTGCSQDVASINDVHVPAMTHERFPIKVQEIPEKLTLRTDRGRLSAEDKENVAQYARHALKNLPPEISVSYPSGSAKAKTVAREVTHILSSEGVDQNAIRMTYYDGSSDVVSLVYMRQTAVTEQCGDWSRNLANDSDNELYPNFGCAAQKNLAAMVAKPEDFQKPREMKSPSAASRMPEMKTYEAGEWSSQPAQLPSAVSNSSN